jgi:photosystem II stability/assembly factor-like uncharacterized protein
MARAQHLRVFACAIANDSAGAFMGGSSNGSGLYQSDDTGKTWKHLGWDNIKCYSMDIVQRTNGRILYMGTGLGVLKSTDYGEHWKQVTDWRVSEVLDIAVNFPDSNNIFIATAHGIWRSNDGGQTWNKSNKGLRVHFISRIEFEDNNIKYLVAGTEDGPYGSRDGGKTWKAVNPWALHRKVRDINQGVNDWTFATDGYGVDNWGKRHPEEEFNNWREMDTVWALGGFNLEDFTWGGPGGTIVHRRSYKGERSNLRNLSSSLHIDGLYELAARIDGGVYYRNWNEVNFEPRGLSKCDIWRLKFDFIEPSKFKQPR